MSRELRCLLCLAPALDAGAVLDLERYQGLCEECLWRFGAEINPLELRAA